MSGCEPRKFGIAIKRRLPGWKGGYWLEVSQGVIVVRRDWFRVVQSLGLAFLFPWRLEMRADEVHMSVTKEKHLRFSMLDDCEPMLVCTPYAPQYIPRIVDQLEKCGFRVEYEEHTRFR